MTITDGIVRRARWSLASATVASLCACGGGGDAQGPESEVAAAQLTSAHALGVEKSGYVNKVASANAFQYNDAIGCVATNMSLVAGVGKTLVDGTTTTEPFLSIYVSTDNYCTGESISSMSGGIQDPDIKINKDLSVAKVKGKVAISDASGTTSIVKVDLQWTGGTLFFSMPFTKVITKTPTTRTVLIDCSAYRYTEAVVGTLVLDGVDLVSPANPTPWYIYGGVALGESIQKTQTR